jgi:hypothetical protein
LTQRPGFPIPSPAILERIWLRFCEVGMEFVAEGEVPVVCLAKGDGKLEVMCPHLDRLVRPAQIHRKNSSTSRRGSPA